MTTPRPSRVDWSVKLIPDSSGNDESFVLATAQGVETVSLHDYPRVYAIPGLYEHVVHDLLKCASPSTAAQMASRVATELGLIASESRVLDLGAGIGISGAELRSVGFKYIVGLDSIQQARIAVDRDRPNVYQQYVVAETERDLVDAFTALRDRKLNILTCVGALGDNHVPIGALFAAINSLSQPAIAIFTVGERSFTLGGTAEFSTELTHLFKEGYLRLLHNERFVHRIRMDGSFIQFRAVAAVREKYIPSELIDSNSDSLS